MVEYVFGRQDGTTLRFDVENMAAWQVEQLRAVLELTNAPTAPVTQVMVEAERARLVERNARFETARERAKHTLRRMLTPQQARTLETRHFFQVTGSEGNLYEIQTGCGYSGNIEWVDEGRHPLGRFCCHPNMVGIDPLTARSDRLPPEDAYIAQKLALETDELGFLRTTVLNWGRFPSIVREKHADPPELKRHQRCRCEKCELARRSPHRLWNVC